jgi:uncharacterized membrane protein
VVVADAPAAAALEDRGELAMLTRRALLKRLDVARIERAIAAAERRTSAELRVSVAPFFWGNVEATARRAFERLKMHETQAHNGVLFFVVPSRKTFVVLGDAGIHERVGREFWQTVVRVMEPHFARRDFSEGLVAGITAAGEALAMHYPYDATDRNELPDDVDI